MVKKIYKSNNLNFNNKYLWGWKSQNKIKQLIKKKLYNKKKIRIPTNIYQTVNSYNTHIKLGVKYGYLSVYNNFLDKEYIFLNNVITSTSLSIFLDEIKYNKNLDKLNKIKDISDIKVDILDNWFEIDSIYSNDKLFGLYNQHEILHHLTAGLVGPEVRSIWDQEQYIQKIRIKYEYRNRIDIFEYERDIMIPDSEWQISNINDIFE